MVLEALLFKKMRPKWNEMQSLFEVIFFRVFFGQLSVNLGKILRIPKNLPAPTPMIGYGSTGFRW